ncbi:hypothetical protein SCHIN_v1c11890 [Spiroplasma chinense]|uniref:Uncharacterized protein n=1 Tax=Spiroplasma chinense TaxID=216932 RepID=A0A5B9Y8N6_9MOLU|nr:hypothetical protein [Spiroplasma chinense]QEH62382.1 hypothetical protein SCHIN_v1c11890 [Spiroplasma chinense]
MKKFLKISGLSLILGVSTNLVEACQSSLNSNVYDLSNLSDLELFANEEARVVEEKVTSRIWDGTFGLTSEEIENSFEVFFINYVGQNDYLNSGDIIKINSTNSSKHVKGEASLIVSKFDISKIDMNYFDNYSLHANVPWTFFKESIISFLNRQIRRELILENNYKFILEPGTLVQEFDNAPERLVGEKTIIIRSVDNSRNFITGSISLKTIKYDLNDFELGMFRVGLEKEKIKEILIGRIKLLNGDFKYGKDYGIEFEHTGNHLQEGEKITIYSENSSTKLKGIKVLDPNLV